jgi:hypothetical protein
MNVTIRIRRNQGLLTIAVALVLSACSGSGAPAPTAPVSNAGGAIASAPVSNPGAAAAATQAPQAQVAGTRDACALVTEKEATAFLGSDPGPGTSTNAGAASACSYSGSLGIGVEGGDGVAQFGLKKSSMQGLGSLQTFSGVGDDAFATIVANTIADMEILKGSTLLSILVQGDPSLQNITPDALRALGSSAAGRL